MSEDIELLEDIERDLSALIQDQGLTPTRLEAYGANIIQIFGFLPAADIDKIVREAVLEMPQDKYTWALAYALGTERNLIEDSGRLTDRRAFLMKQDGFDVSEDTLRRWERRAIKTLARHIVARARRLEGGREVFGDGHDEAVPNNAEVLLEYFEKLDRLQERVRKLEARVKQLES